MILRGDLWWADLGEPRGSAPAFTRVVVVQSDSFNRSRLRTVIVVGLTTNTRLAQMPGNVFIPAQDGGLGNDSVANVTQLATLDRSDLVEHLGQVPEHIMYDIEEGLRLALAV